MRLVMLREYRVSDRSMSFRPSGASGEICPLLEVTLAFRQTAARESPFCALCLWLRCAEGRLRP